MQAIVAQGHWVILRRHQINANHTAVGVGQGKGKSQLAEHLCRAGGAAGLLLPAQADLATRLGIRLPAPLGSAIGLIKLIQFIPGSLDLSVQTIGLQPGQAGGKVRCLRPG